MVGFGMLSPSRQQLPERGGNANAMATATATHAATMPIQ